MKLKQQPAGWVKYKGALPYHRINRLPKRGSQTFPKDTWRPVHHEEDFEFLKRLGCYETTKKQPKEAKGSTTNSEAGG